MPRKKVSFLHAAMHIRPDLAECRRLEPVAILHTHAKRLCSEIFLLPIQALDGIKAKLRLRSFIIRDAFGFQLIGTDYGEVRHFFGDDVESAFVFGESHRYRIRTNHSLQQLVHGDFAKAEEVQKMRRHAACDCLLYAMRSDQAPLFEKPALAKQGSGLGLGEGPATVVGSCPFDYCF